MLEERLTRFFVFLTRLSSVTWNNFFVVGLLPCQIVKQAYLLWFDKYCYLYMWKCFGSLLHCHRDNCWWIFSTPNFIHLKLNNCGFRAIEGCCTCHSPTKQSKIIWQVIMLQLFHHLCRSVDGRHNLYCNLIIDSMCLMRLSKYISYKFLANHSDKVTPGKNRPQVVSRKMFKNVFMCRYGEFF